MNNQKEQEEKTTKVFNLNELENIDLYVNSVIVEKFRKTFPDRKVMNDVIFSEIETEKTFGKELVYANKSLLLEKKIKMNDSGDFYIEVIH